MGRIWTSDVGSDWPESGAEAMAQGVHLEPRRSTRRRSMHRSPCWTAVWPWYCFPNPRCEQKELGSFKNSACQQCTTMGDAQPMVEPTGTIRWHGTASSPRFPKTPSPQFNVMRHYPPPPPPICTLPLLSPSLGHLISMADDDGTGARER